MCDLGGRDEADVVRAVIAGLARLVAADGGRLDIRSYEPECRRLTLVLSDRPPEVDGSLVADFLVEVLCLHGLWLAELRVETEGEETT